jgi:hypothetical protein
MNELVETKALEVATDDQQNCQLNRSIYLSLIYLSAAPHLFRRTDQNIHTRYNISSGHADLMIDVTAYGTLYSSNFSFYRSKKNTYTYLNQCSTSETEILKMETGIIMANLVCRNLEAF